MNYIISANSDIGIKKSTNQDNLFVKVFNTSTGKMTLAVLCDGMGGLQKGEVASAVVIDAFNDWAINQLSVLSTAKIDKDVIAEQWNDIVQQMNTKIMDYGKSIGINLGTTCVALLLTDYGYFAMNVGDSRIYEISDTLVQLTNDQTLVAREVSLGKLTPEQAEKDPRRSILLQCVGASKVVKPEFIFGDTTQDCVYMLCSDGFRHEVTPEEILAYFNPSQLVNTESMKKNILTLIETNKARLEQDNISVITIRTTSDDFVPVCAARTEKSAGQKMVRSDDFMNVSDDKCETNGNCKKKQKCRMAAFVVSGILAILFFIASAFCYYSAQNNNKDNDIAVGKDTIQSEIDTTEQIEEESSEVESQSEQKNVFPVID